MNQKIALNQAIKYVIIGLALFLFSLIWPLNLWQKTEVSKSNEIQVEESGPISVAKNGTQLFWGKKKELKTVSLYVTNEMQSETVTFRIYDGGYNQIWETFYVVDKNAKFPGFLQIPVGIDTEDMLYFYTVEGLTKDLHLAYEETAATGTEVNQLLLYGGEQLPGVNIITRYIYEEPFKGYEMLGISVLLLVSALIFCKITDICLLQRFQGKNREITVQRLLQVVVTPVLAVGLIRILWAVFPGRRFGVGIANYGFYYLGILVTALVLFFGINYKRKSDTVIRISKEDLMEKVPLWLMAVCFAKILWSCYEYINGLYEIHHTWATCKILTWLGLAFLCTLKKEEWLKLWNLIYMVLAGVAAYLRYKPFMGIDSQEAVTGRLQVRLTFVAGFVALQILVSLIQLLLKKRKANGTWSYGYLAVFGLVMVFMIVFRNTREWPIIAAIMFGAFYYRMWLWEKRSYLMQIFSNGIILNFIYMVYYCLMHRPYHRFRMNRFGMGFHTVTMTGYYLALVLCAVIIRLFAKYYKTYSWQECWKELSLLGIGNAYLFMTLSRTGYLATFVMEIFMCIFFVILKEKKRVSGIIKKLAMGLVVSVMFFPIVFTAQRILPTLVNQPMYSEVEIWEYTVQKGTPKDSELYIDINAFVRIALNKLLGMDAGNFSLSSAEPVYVVDDTIMVANEAELNQPYDVTSGRLDIFREYIKEWNLNGHEDMGFLMSNGKMAAHAHNSFLQMIHDHGLITGILFLVFGVLSFLLSIRNYSIKKQEGEKFYNALSIAVIIAFAFAGMVEWIFHFANPVGFSLYIVMTPLLFREKKKSCKAKIRKKRTRSRSVRE